MLGTVTALAAAAWAVGIGVVTQRQDRLIFGMPRVRRTAPTGPHAGHVTQPVTLDVQAGIQLHGWLTLPPDPHLPPTHLVVWFGGRDEDVGWVSALATWLGPQWAVCTFHYRGRCGSTGRPSEAGCVQDALAIVAWAAERTGVPVARSVLIGRSLGTGVAMQVAARQPVAGLVLLSPPASLRRLLLRNPLLWPALPLLRHPFDSLAVAHRVRCPSLVLLAEEDRRVPHAHSRRLVAALQRAVPGAPADHCRVVTIAGTDHRTLARHAQGLAAMAGFAVGLAGHALPAERLHRTAR